MSKQAEWVALERRMAVEQDRAWAAAIEKYPVVDFLISLPSKQLLAIQKLFCAGFNDQANLHPETTICRRFELLRVTSKLVGVTLEFERTDLRGTMAGILFSTRGAFYVSKRGKVEALFSPKGRKGKAKKYPAIYGWIH